MKMYCFASFWRSLFLVVSCCFLIEMMFWSVFELVIDIRNYSLIFLFCTWCCTAFWFLLLFCFYCLLYKLLKGISIYHVISEFNWRTSFPAILLANSRIILIWLAEQVMPFHQYLLLFQIYFLWIEMKALIISCLLCSYLDYIYDL